MCILHRYLVPTLVHLRTYQVRPFIAPLLQNGDFRKRKLKKKKKEIAKGAWLFFACKTLEK